MIVYTTDQLYVLFVAIFAGCIIGIFYDVFYMIRCMSRVGRYLTGLFDLIFWVLAAILAFVALFFANSGIIRAYSFIGLFLGWILYAFTLSRYVILVMNFLLKITTGIFSLIINAVLWPTAFITHKMRHIKEKYAINFTYKKGM